MTCHRTIHTTGTVLPGAVLWLLSAIERKNEKASFR
jgi:hypothetical protein